MRKLYAFDETLLAILDHLKTDSDPAERESLWDKLLNEDGLYKLLRNNIDYLNYGDPHWNEDILQDVVLAIWQAVEGGRYEHRGRFVAFVLQVARHKVSEFYRITSHYKPLDDLELHHQANTPDPEADAIRRDLFNRVMSRLTEQERDIMRLYMQGYKLVEIARLLDMKANTVAKIKSRAATRLRFTLMLSPTQEAEAEPLKS